jgi:hypothetical protein
MSAAAVLRLALTPALVALAWGVWEHGGVVLEWASLGELDVPGRLGLVFLALGLADAVLARVPGLGPERHR